MTPGPTVTPTQPGFHPSLGIPLIITNNDRREYQGTATEFPSLFRDSSDHHSLTCLMKSGNKKRFHPSLGIPLIITDPWLYDRDNGKGGFHPSLGIPLIITRLTNDVNNKIIQGFHPSLGIPLIITWYSI